MDGGSIVATLSSSPFTSHVSIVRGFGGYLGFLAFSLLAFQFINLALFNVAFLIVVTIFATKPTGDGTPEVMLMID